MRLVWTDPALDDMGSILVYVAERDPEAAWELRSKFHRAALSLLEFPYKGKRGRVENTRELIIQPSYLLVYRVEDPIIRILALVHMAQNYPLNLFPEF